ncbi:hypothetical protein NC652_038832 [Populus alba x Populus x berolinensis]|nr:hypothetical protein NC652_038832 [Populus alba x Populus x berolinensis]
MVGTSGRERSSWSVLMPSATQQQHHSNLERFLQCVTPTPPSKFLPQSCILDLNSLWQPLGTKDMHFGRFMDCYDEWSAYGAGTQVALSSGETIRQYYVPYLSAIQIYSNKSVNSREYNDVVELESDSWSDDSMSDKLSRSPSNNSSKTWDTISEDSSYDHEGCLSMRDKLGYLYFQYFEISSPYWRVPLMEKVTELSRNNPVLMTLTNVDLSPASTPYIIFHLREMIKDLSTCFLTYHTLSSSFQGSENNEKEMVICTFPRLVWPRTKCKGSLDKPRRHLMMKEWSILGKNLERTGLGEAKAVQIASLENKEGEADSLLEQIVNSSGAIPSRRKEGVMWPVVVIFAGGFLSGLLALVALQALGVYVLIKRLNRKTQQQQASHSSSSPPHHQDLDPQQSLDYAHNKKGYVWVLDPDQVLKNWPVEKVQKDQKKKKELLEVNPIRKQAKIKDRSLILTDSGGSHRVIPLKGCAIEAVSATSLSSRKWAKRFPIKVESKTSPIYNASKTTSWEKESWCKALRLASSDDQEKLNWFIKLNEEFLRYLTSLNTEYPSFMKPSVGFYVEPIDRASRFDGSESKVRLFWKKLAKKASKSGVENKVSSLLGREERKINDKYHPSHDPAFSGSVGKNDPTLKAPITSEEENILLPSSSTSSRASSLSQLQVISDTDADEKLNVDEGTLCWNLIISRLFFDAKSNDRMKSLMQARIQRTLSNMRTPSYIGEIICTDLNLGNLPPYIHGIRVLPTHMNEVWAWEVDIEYLWRKGVVDTDVGSSSVRDASSDLLEGFEDLGKQLNFSEGTVDSQEWKDEGNPKSDKIKDSKSGISTSTNVSRWKSLLNSVAKQVSQVPLSLSIRLGSLRGTVRLHIKPPPSDQLWFGFTSTPDVEFDLESSVGERKITSGQVALYLINKFKAAIRRQWFFQIVKADNAAALELLNSQLDAKTKIEAGRETSYNHPESKHQKTRNAENVQPPYSDSSDDLSSNKPSMKNDKSSQDLTSPLLANSEAPETGQKQLRTRSVEEDDSRPKKMGRRAKMLDLGKKMGEKFEEKRRNIEEKGRNIVDKMRGP